MIRSKGFTVFSLLLFLCIFTTSCGEAVVGYTAPQGAEVTTDADSDVTIHGSSPFYLFYDFFVKDEEDNPLNGVGVQLVCNMCSIRDTAAADGELITDVSQTSVMSNPYFVETNSRGGYQIILELAPPSAYGVSEYTAQIGVNIGVTDAVSSFTVKEPGD